MSDTLQMSIDKSIKLKKTRQKKQSELDDFKLWLAGLGMVSAPTLHVNGMNHSMAVVAVDFGTPLDEPNKLTTDQGAELVTRMKTITKSMYKNEVNVRVQSDSGNGVWWSSVN
jgi:hypothetical protein